MSDMDRFTVSGVNSLTAEEHVDYIESNCVSDPLKMCDFTRLDGRILKTVDSIHQDVASLEQCRQMCLQSVDFRCHTFDYGDTGVVLVLYPCFIMEDRLIVRSYVRCSPMKTAPPSHSLIAHNKNNMASAAVTLAPFNVGR